MGILVFKAVVAIVIIAILCLGAATIFSDDKPRGDS